MPAGCPKSARLTAASRNAMIVCTMAKIVIGPRRSTVLTATLAAKRTNTAMPGASNAARLNAG